MSAETMRIAFISPFSTGPMRGNITTVRRIAAFVGQAGAETLVLPRDTMAAAEIGQRLAAFAPDIIHGFHACHCGETASCQAELLDIPCVITITGSDIHDPLHRDDPATARAMAGAAAIVCFDEFVAADVVGHFPRTADRIAVVPQGVEPLPVSGAVPAGIPDDAFVLLLPSALRPVKNIEFPLTALAPVVRAGIPLLLAIAGGAIDREYAAGIRGMIDACPFATWLGEVPYERMGDLYARAGLVLNCSAAEAMPNSLLEAMALGRPVLAADIPGNRSLVRDGVTGWLYRDEAEFRAQVRRLAGNAGLRAAGGRRARDYVLSRFSPGLEAGRYLELYAALRR
jgi:glycosyltransferase involved in cell wall biosynthesis